MGKKDMKVDEIFIVLSVHSTKSNFLWNKKKTKSLSGISKRLKKDYMKKRKFSAPPPTDSFAGFFI